MEEKKTRTVVRADGSEPAKKAPAAKKVKEAAPAAQEGSATGLRVGAFVLWFVGIAMEVVAFLILTNKIYLGDKQTVGIIVALVIDFIAVVIASQLWKKSNKIDPASEKDKVRFVLHNNLGVLMSLIAFVPIIILLLKDKENLDPKTKKYVAIGVIVAALIATGTSVDYNPISAEQKALQLEEAAAASVDEVYWTTFGHKYHYDQDCQSLTNSPTLYEGSVEQAIESGRTELCSFCEKKFAAAPAGNALTDAVEAVTDALTEAQPAA